MLADFLTKYKDAFSDGAAVIALIVFCFGVWQFRVGQIWKRNEFLAREIKDFLDDKYVQETISIFDYIGRKLDAKHDNKSITIIVYHNRDDLPSSTETKWYVNLSDALRYHQDGPISSAEREIRDRIDKYFTYFERLYVFQQNGLFTNKELTPFILYHVELFNGNKSHSHGYHKNLFAYLVLYDFRWALQLLESYPQTDEIKCYISDARERKKQLELSSQR